MKTLKIALTAACIATLITAKAEDFAPKLKTIPIILAPIVSPGIGAFWLTAAAVGVLMEIEEAASEPLENYEVGIQHSTGSMSANISWPDGEYQTRDFEAERVYDFDVSTRVGRWWIKTTFTSYHREGPPFVETVYSTDPPIESGFENMDVSYERIGQPGRHESTFVYDAFEEVTAYCARRGSAAWCRPVMAIINGWIWDDLWVNDTMYDSPVGPYEDKHYLMIGPGGWALFKPHFVPNTKIYSSGVATLFFTP